MTGGARAGSPRTTKDTAPSLATTSRVKRRDRNAPCPREYTFPLVRELPRRPEAAPGSSEVW
jgi:hypothetical protein